MNGWNDYVKEWKKKLPSFSKERLQYMDKIARIPAGKDNLLPPLIAVNEKIKEPQEQKIRIRFDYYCEDECKFDNFSDTHIKSLIAQFKQITDCTINSLASSGIIRDTLCPGNRHKAYNSLFLKVPPDANIDESELPGAGRFFFYRAQDVVQVISIETQHRNLN